MQLDSARSRSPCCLKTTCVPELEKSGVSATGASWISKSWLLKFRPWPVSLFSSGMYFCNKSGTSSTCPNTFRIKKCRVEGFTVYSFLQWQPLPLPSKPGGVVCPASRGKSSSLLTTFSCWSSKDVLNVEKKKARETMKCQLLQTNGFHPTNTHSYMQTLISRIQLYIKYINLP